MIRSIGASIGVTVCFFYLGCGSIQVASASGGANNAPLTIATKLLPSAIAGTPYVVVLDATGGTPGYTWNIASGKLPSGISLTPTTGIISGTPTMSGTFSIGVTLSDASNPTQKKTSTVTVTVAPPPLAIITSALPSATDGTAYSQALRAAGGTPSYTWSITSGALPAGLSLENSTGVISGTSKGNGTSSFAITVRDSERPAQSRSIATSISVAPSPLKIVTLTLPSATGGTRYSQVLLATGGTPGYKWAITSGNLPSGLTLTQSTGAITGMPVSGGTTSFTVSVSDGSSPAQATSAPITIVVAPTPLTITSSALLSGTVGAAYSRSLGVTGGSGPYTWSITSGQLPAGLALTPSTGAISGTPTTAGTATIVVSVLDSSNPTRSASATTALIVKPTPLAIQPSTLPTVRVGSPYSRTLLATGGTAPYVWSITSGRLPAGLTLASSVGMISGVPTASGTSTFTATVTDNGRPTQAASATVAVVVAPTLLAITSSTLPPVSVGTAYSQSLHASGGSAPYSLAVTSGNLPAGIRMTSSGTIVGTPTASGTSTFTATVTDSSGPAQVTSATTTIVVTPKASAPIGTPPITPVPTPLAITTTTLPSSTVGTSYAQTLQAIGGTAPYAWSITSGQLPAGLSFSATTGTISGIPTSGGSSSFTVSVSDSSSTVQTQSAAMTIVAADSPLTILTPTLPPGTSGTAYSQALRAIGGTPAYTWSIASGALPAGLTLAATTGMISGTPASSGTFSFTTTVADNGSPVQKQSVATSITVAAAQVATGSATTWFVRLDGGTALQCTGHTNAPYTGGTSAQWTAAIAYSLGQQVVDPNNNLEQATTAGTSASRWPPSWSTSTGGTTSDNSVVWTNEGPAPANQNCAVNHPFWLLNQSTWTWNVAANDTVKFADQGPYYIGLGPLNGLGSYWQYCNTQNSACYLPPPPNGVSLLGFNSGSCHNSTHSALVNPTQLLGINEAFTAIDIHGTVGVDVECFDISQPDMCTRSGIGAIPTSLNCNPGTNNYIYDGGVILSYLPSENGPSNGIMRDMQIHGLASEAITGGKMNTSGTIMTFSDIYMYGNANTGWDGDAGGCTTNCESTGTINLSYINAYWSGCMEVKPNGGTVGGNGVTTCVDQAYNGNGDNIVMIATGGTWNWNHIITKWGMQDGVDLLHTGDDIASGVVINMDDVDSEGNEGQAWKVGGTATGTNMRLITNCERSQYPFAPNPAGYNAYAGLPCRAFDGLTLSVSPGHSITVENSTIVGGGANPLIDIECYDFNGAACTPNSYSVVLKNDLLLGYNNPVTGTVPGGLYWQDLPSDPFTQTGSAISNILWAPNTMRASTGGGPANGCPQAPSDEKNSVCADPLLMGEISPNLTTLDNFDINPQAGSPAIGAGVSTGVVLDLSGNTRPATPSIGAIE